MKPSLAPIMGLAVVAVFWVLGTRFGWSVQIIVFALAVLVLLGGAVMAGARWLMARRAKRLEVALQTQATAAAQGARPERREELEQARMGFERAIHALKSSKLGRGRGGRDALYALPWYVLVGPPAAGKTTALTNSGLDFPFGTERVRGVGGTRNCDWFFGKTAIFLDTAGRYAVEDEDRDEWLAFLDLLRKHRRGRSVNGVLAFMDLAELADATPAQVEWHAARLRDRLDELVGRLGVRLPVYLVFTKADLLQGFAETFEDLSQRERAQVWGATLPAGLGERAAERFEAELDRLLAALKEHRLVRLADPMKREARQRVFVFPVEVERLRRKLSPFVGRLFQHNPYQENPVFRGFYLTSGTQEGAPIDRVIQAVAREFRLPEAFADGPGEVEAKAYFVRDLFTEVVVPDRDLATVAARRGWRPALTRYGAVAGLGLLSAALALGVVSGCVRSADAVAGVDAAATATAPVSWSGARAEPTAYLQRLDGLRAAIVEAEAQGPLGTLGLTQRRRVVPPAEALFLRKADPFVQDYLYRALEGGVQRVGEGVDPRSHGQRRATLQAYLLLGDSAAHLQDPAERAALRRTLLDLHGTHQRLLGGGPGGAAAVIERVVAFYADRSGSGGLRRRTSNRFLVAQARAALTVEPNPQYLLDRIRDEQVARVPDVTVGDLVGEAGEGVFVDSGAVAGFYTREAWAGYVEAEIVRRSQHPDLDDWVLGTDGRRAPEVMRQPTALEAELRRRYAADQAEAWMAFLRGVRYRPPPTLQAAAARLGALADAKDSPVVVLLRGATERSRLVDPAGAEGEGWFERTWRRLVGKAAASDSTGPAAGPVGDAVARLADVQALGATDDAGDPPEPIKAVLAQYENAYDQVRPFAERAPDDEPAAGVVDLGANRAAIRTALGDFDRGLRRALFEEPLDGASTEVAKAGGAAAAAAAAAAVAEAWSDGLTGPFNERIAPFYPFAASGPDLPRDNFEEFFGPGGTLDAFAEAHGDALEDGAHAQAAATVRRLKTIQDAFFRGDEFGVVVWVMPESEGVPAERIVLTVNGQVSKDEMGLAEETKVAWPGEGPPGASLQATTQTGVVEGPRGPGEWGWFRLLDKATIQPRDGGRYAASWTLAGRSGPLTLRYALRPEAGGPPLDDLRGFFRVAPPAALR